MEIQVLQAQLYAMYVGLQCVALMEADTNSGLIETKADKAYQGTLGSK